MTKKSVFIASWENSTLCSKVLKSSQGGSIYRGMRTRWEITELVLKKERLGTNKEWFSGHVRQQKELRNAQEYYKILKEKSRWVPLGQLRSCGGCNDQKLLQTSKNIFSHPKVLCAQDDSSDEKQFHKLKQNLYRFCTSLSFTSPLSLLGMFKDFNIYSRMLCIPEFSCEPCVMP